MVMMTLIWLRHYIVCQSTVQRYTTLIIDILFEKYNSEILFPSVQDRWKKSAQFKGAKITVVVDGSEQQVGIPGNKQKEKSLFSGKKQLHTFTLLLVCGVDGRVYFLSMSYQGSKNDMNLIGCEENSFWKGLDDWEYICADKGFRGLQHKWPNIVLPYIGDQLTEEEKEFNKGVARIRIVVENVFSHLKKWRICKYTFRGNINDIDGSLIRHNKIWVVVAGLYNDFVAPIRNCY